jgi:hypothetical protein
MMVPLGLPAIRTELHFGRNARVASQDSPGWHTKLVPNPTDNRAEPRDFVQEDIGRLRCHEHAAKEDKADQEKRLKPRLSH